MCFTLLKKLSQTSLFAKKFSKHYNINIINCIRRRTQKLSSLLKLLKYLGIAKTLRKRVRKCSR